VLSLAYANVFQMQPIHALTAADFSSSSVYIVDGVFELYVIVGKNARDKRDDIILALDLTEVGF
jgi:hypothetical protein